MNLSREKSDVDAIGHFKPVLSEYLSWTDAGAVGTRDSGVTWEHLGFCGGHSISTGNFHLTSPLEHSMIHDVGQFLPVLDGDGGRCAGTPFLPCAL